MGLHNVTDSLIAWHGGEVAPITVMRDWKLAKSGLRRQLDFADDA